MIIMNKKANFIEVIKNFITGKKIYFITAACILFIGIIGAFAYLQTEKISQTPEKLMKKADEMAAENKMAFAIEKYTEIVEHYPKNYNAHLKFAELLLKAKERDLAKVEYLRAIELNYKNRIEAHVAMSNLYIAENQFKTGEEYILRLKENKTSKAQEAIGDFYYSWGLSLKESNKGGAVRKFKTSHNYYEKAGSKKTIAVRKDIREVYISMADELLKYDKYQDAIQVLRLSVNFKNNADSRYKLGQIYQKLGKIDEAADEYKIAFKIDPKVNDPSPYVDVLLQKAEQAIEKGDNTSAELYFTRAKKMGWSEKVFDTLPKKLILSVNAANANQNIEKDILIPYLVLKLKNISKYDIKNLSIKVEFLEKDSVFAREIIRISSKETPLKKHSETKELEVISSRMVLYAFDNHHLFANVYVSNHTPDNWILLRKINLQIVKESDIPMIEDR
jgi:tetratricopeptide (TPR) repeat protein